MATIKDIANLAGVSTSSVSRVLNNDFTLSISEEKREKIIAVAQQLSYKKHQYKQLDNSKTIAIHTHLKDEEVANLLYNSIQKGIENRAKRKGLKVIFNSSNDIVKKKSNISGVIAIGKFTKDEAIELSSIHETIVFVDCCPNQEKYDSVIINYRDVVQKVVDYLLSIGHQRIGFIGCMEHEEIEMSFYQYMTEKGMLNESYIYVNDKYDVDSGYQLMRDAIREHGESLPTAFLASDDIFALGCVRILLEEGIDVPGRVNIIGINNIYVTKLVYPLLTTVNVNAHSMGETAVDLLVDRMDEWKVPKKVSLATALVKRQTSF